MKDKLFFYVKKVIDQKKRYFFLIGILSFFSLFYRLLTSFRNFLYDLKIFKQKEVKKIKIISIGNIVVGGAGKTPFIIFLANQLAKKNNKIAIITRGYKSKYENKSLIIDKNSKFLKKDMPDEAMIFLNRIKNPFIFIGKKKYLSIKKAETSNFDIALIDDGFQTRELKKNLEIVILNAKNPFGNDSFLPRGYLREPIKSLKRADFIVVNNAKSKILDLEAKIKKYSKSPIIYTKPVAIKLLDLFKNKIIVKKNSKVAIFSAIANTDLFYSTIKDLKFEIVNCLDLLDHAKISIKLLKNFIKESLKKKATIIITTEKDAVKLDPSLKFDLPIVYLEVGLKITFNNQLFRGLVEKIMK